MDTLSIIDAFSNFNLVLSQSHGWWISYRCRWFACATYRRSTNYIRVPTTLIGLVDAGVAIKVAVNHGKLKKSSGCLPRAIILIFSFLQTLSDQTKRQWRNLWRSRLSRTLKYLSCCMSIEITFNLIGYVDSTPELKFVATHANDQTIWES